MPKQNFFYGWYVVAGCYCIDDTVVYRGPNEQKS